ncbi:guanylate-binding protein 1-like [Latimeria chalumnae]|uniref:guanylate-binding protein 1-like n=1 Tax=Latimeria chalumnae TaxID=7897 RepID=UPI00313B5B3E
MSSIPILEAPVCMLENSGEAKLRLHPEALEILQSIEQPLVVVAVVRLYRTGKSFLMNKLAKKNSGFSLRSTVQSHTKGIWMWCIPHPCKPGLCLVIIDTESLEDVEKGDQKNDQWLFALSILMSSMLIYNSMKIIDQNALFDLHLVTKLTDLIKVQKGQEETGEDYRKFSPKFVWAVRGFDLELKIKGRKVTEDGFLEFALQLKKGKSESIKNYNFQREWIRDFFPCRICFTFPRPIDNKNPKDLDKILDHELVKDFVEVSKKFCSYIYDYAKPKCVQGAVLNGRLFATLLEKFVEFIHSGQAPCLESAVTQMAQIENSKAVEEAVQCYQESMEKLVKFPMESDKLSKHHRCDEEKAYDTFRKCSFMDEQQEFQQKLQSDLESSYKQYHSKNKHELEVFCSDRLRKVFQFVEKKVEQNAYQRPGGFRDCKQASNVLSEFQVKKETEMKIILQMDKDLTEKEKEITAEKEKAARVEQRNQAQEEQVLQIQKQLEDVKKSSKENIEKLLQKME